MRLAYNTPYRLSERREINGTLHAEAGATVYLCQKYDYGCSSDDTRGLGIEHTSVTLDPTGDYPFFTVPVAHLAPVSVAQ